MLAPAHPVDESERLADLRALNILDTPPERRFDGIVQLAAQVFDVPIAYIAMIDSDRQWFKAKCGIGADQTARDVSFCGHTILSNEPLIVPDAKEDSRFHDNPLVTDQPHIRFYAGHPLVGPGGHNVGTLCLASPNPRNLSPHELAVFREMARLAENELNLVDLIEVQRRLLETQKRLVESQKRLATELAQAAQYVKSLLPAKLNGTIRTDWRFISSSQLGGDFFGYHWLDERRLAVYLLDVCGHGVGSALLSISVQAALRRQSLPDTNFGDPAGVVSALNRAFPMDENDNRFFSIWYGVYDRADRTIQFCSGGHPPALLLLHDSARQPIELGRPQIIVGFDPAMHYDSERFALPAGGRLYVYSDGVYEVSKPSGGMVGTEGFARVLAETSRDGPSRLDAVVNRIRELHGSDEFEDDVSLLELQFE